MPEPEPLGDPVRGAERVGEPEERPHREQVAELLVGHGAGGDVRIPEPRHPGEEAPRIEVQVLLRVAREPAGRREQEGHVGQQHERDHVVRGPAPDGAGSSGPGGRHARRDGTGRCARCRGGPGARGRGQVHSGRWGTRTRARMDDARAPRARRRRGRGALAPLRLPRVLLEPGRTGLPVADRRPPRRLPHHPDPRISHLLPSVAGRRPEPLVLLPVHARMAAGAARGRRRDRHAGRRARARRGADGRRDLPARTRAGRRPRASRCSRRW